MSLIKSIVALVATPVFTVVDLVTLPKSAYNDEHPFSHTLENLKLAKCEYTEKSTINKPLGDK